MTAAETIARLGPTPRAQAVVDRIAGPVVAKNQSTRRRFRAVVFVLAIVLSLLIVLAPSSEAAVAVDVMLVLALGFVGFVWSIWMRPTMGRATELVRNGIASPVKVTMLVGSANLGRRYRFDWTDLGGHERQVILPEQIPGAPPFGEEAVVLLHPQRGVVGILVDDWLSVV